MERRGARGIDAVELRKRQVGLGLEGGREPEVRLGTCPGEVLVGRREREIPSIVMSGAKTVRETGAREAAERSFLWLTLSESHCLVPLGFF